MNNNHMKLCPYMDNNKNNECVKQKLLLAVKCWKINFEKYTCTGVLLLSKAAIESPSSTMTNLLWVKLVNRPGAKTEKMKSFPGLGCETWQQCGTVPPQHFWRQWCHKCDLSPTHCKVPPGPRAGDFSPQLGCKNITTFHKCSPSRPVSQIGTIKMLTFRAMLFPRYNSLSYYTFCSSVLISAHKYNK